MLYTSPSGAVQIVFVWISLAFVCLWPNRRCAIVIGFTIVPLTGIILLFVLPLSAGWGMIIASWLVRPITYLTAPPKPAHSVDNLFFHYQASIISNIFSILLSLNASNTRGNTKKAIVNALFFVGYAVGSICGPLLWDIKYAPRYRSGLVLALVSWLTLIPSVGVYWFSGVYENRRRRRVEGDNNNNEVAQVVGDDLTDKQDRAFRYTL